MRSLMLFAGSFIWEWLRVRSGSVWTSALPRASHNTFIHTVFDGMTESVGRTLYFTTGFGAGLIISIGALEVYFWIRRRDAVEVTAMRRSRLALVLAFLPALLTAQSATYIGFDRNQYPGDSNLKALHQTFAYAGYWLNNAPGENNNSWAGHRAAVEAAGFGFLVLFNGRLYAELKSETKATALGRSDAANATATARREGFQPGTIIFLDQEQGGRMLSEQKAYIYAWVDRVIAAGFRAGIYCSGTGSTDSNHVVTANDIRDGSGGRDITYWVTNDTCPPAPGCAFPAHSPDPRESGVRFAEVWQFAQTPRRKDVAAHCSNYNRDGNCYAPSAPGIYVDVNSALSSDPSRGRTR